MSPENQNQSVESKAEMQEITLGHKQKQNLIQTKLLTRKLLMQLGFYLASLGILSRGMVLAEMVLEIEVYDYEPSYQPAPVDTYPCLLYTSDAADDW